MTAIFTVEAACSAPGCEVYEQRSLLFPQTMGDATKWLRSIGWSVRAVDGRLITRCPQHRRKRLSP